MHEKGWPKESLGEGKAGNLQRTSGRSMGAAVQLEDVQFGAETSD